jgi:flagellar hook-associated protein 3 FlgL
MRIRPTQNTTYELVRSGIDLNLARLIRAQEQISSGKKLLRPSDDPVAAAAVLALQRQLGDVSRFSSAIGSAKPLLASGIGALGSASQVLTEARTLAVSGLNGTLNDSDRHAIAQDLRQLKTQLLDLANTKFGESYVFGGTASDAPPFAESEVDGQLKVGYAGNEAAQSVSIGPGVEVAVGIPGSQAFGAFQPTGVQYVGASGVAAGSSADTGTGYGTITIRHDSTSGAIGSQVALANGGADDTLIGTRALVIDAAAGTVKLGNGPALSIPAGSSAGVADFAVSDENGAVVHLDFTNYDGTSSASTLVGDGSVSIDGTNFSALDLGASDMELSDSHGTVLHIDATGIVLATSDLYSFEGAVNAFDVLQGMIDDLENEGGLEDSRVLERLSSRLAEFDRNFDNLQIALGALGSRAQRMDAGKNQLDELSTSLQGLVSDNQDVDLASVILDLNKAQQTLEVAQATGAKLLQNSLLNYLG